MDFSTETSNVTSGLKPHLRYLRITDLTTRFCELKLTPEYAMLAKKMTATLCRRKPSPLLTDIPIHWACAILHALGQLNFLMDPATRPYIREQDLFEWFGVDPHKGGKLSLFLQELLCLNRFSHTWLLPSLYEGLPLPWILSPKGGGVTIDRKDAPSVIQALTYDQPGPLPYIPVVKEKERQETSWEYE